MSNQVIEILESKEILKRLPHRYPFLLIDRVIELVAGQYATAVKNVSINEPYFSGHFPHDPVMPGVLIIEACAQLAGIVNQTTFNPDQSSFKTEYLASVQKFNFKNKVFPGQQLILKAFDIKSFHQLSQINVQVEVNKKLIAEGVLVITNRK